MPLTAEDVKACHAAILGHEIRDDGNIQHLMSTNSSIGELITRFISENGFLSKNFYGKPPFFLTSQSKYLFNDIDEKEHFDYYFYHHNYLCQNLSRIGYLNLTKSGVIIYQTYPRDILYQVMIHQTGIFSFEGELSLSFMANGAYLFNISFNIVPGTKFGSPNSAVILIARIQGWSGKFELIKRATKELGDISPPHLLFSALRGIARSLNIDSIVGVCASKHSSHTPEKDDRFKAIYDAFFEAIGATRSGDGFFEIRISDRSAADRVVKAGHRLRTRRKRKIKTEVEHTVEMISTLMFRPVQPDGPD